MRIEEKCLRAEFQKCAEVFNRPALVELKGFKITPAEVADMCGVLFVVMTYGKFYGDSREAWEMFKKQVGNPSEFLNKLKNLPLQAADPQTVLRVGASLERPGMGSDAL